jgi:inorganic pyrophosphatase
MKEKPFADKHGTLNVVVETPRGRRNKFKYDPAQKVFRLGSVLPAGASFPYDFGFVPGTRAQDGDPLDVLLLMDESAFPGCWVTARLIGVIEAEQTEDGEAVRNDRLLAVATDAHDYRDVRAPSDINTNLLKELEHFFVSYNESKGKQFKLLGVHGPKRAMRLLKETIRRAR